MKFNTKTIHGGQHPDPSTGAVMPPIYQTTTLHKQVLDILWGIWIQQNCKPYTNSFRKCIGEYENGARGLAFSSGLAATDCLMRVETRWWSYCYGWFVGGTYRLFTKYKDSGILFHFVDMNDMENSSHWLMNTKLVWVETPTNPIWWNWWILKHCKKSE
jgi:cystathionine beta-lyase